MNRILLSIVCIVLVAGSAAANPPMNGTYLSTDLPGGTMLTGRFSESWVTTPPAQGKVGNTLHALSWDGTMLATEWKVWCASIGAPPVLISDTRDANGTGNVTYQTDYVGGYFWLSKNGPWGDGTEDYTGSLMSLRVEATYQFVMGNLLGIRSNVTMVGTFDGYDNCMEYVINNTAFTGSTDTSAMPAGYPPFMDTNCGTGTVTSGGWGTVSDIALQVLGSCTIRTEEKSWGAVKALYR
jgi:hypothetical protein